MVIFDLLIKCKDASKRIINQNDGADDDEDDDDDDDEDDAVSSDESDVESGPASDKAINADDASKEVIIFCFEIHI